MGEAGRQAGMERGGPEGGKEGVRREGDSRTCFSIVSLIYSSSPS